MADLSGQRFNKLTVLDKAPPIFSKSGRKRLTWVCKCDCGNTTIVTASNLKHGTQSCGCLTGGNNSHGKTGTRLYSIFNAMKSRCNDKNNSSFEWYGKKGIKVCTTWINNVEEFLTWAECSGYTDSLTIERKDVTKGYSPGNCCWITMAEQALNKNIRKDNKSGYTGVHYKGSSKKWAAAVRYKGKLNNIGLFSSPLEASNARNEFIISNGLPHKLNSL